MSRWLKIFIMAVTLPLAACNHSSGSGGLPPLKLTLSTTTVPHLEPVTFTVNRSQDATLILTLPDGSTQTHDMPGGVVTLTPGYLSSQTGLWTAEASVGTTTTPNKTFSVPVKNVDLVLQHQDEIGTETVTQAFVNNAVYRFAVVETPNGEDPSALSPGIPGSFISIRCDGMDVVVLPVNQFGWVEWQVSVPAELTLPDWDPYLDPPPPPKGLSIIGVSPLGVTPERSIVVLHPDNSPIIGFDALPGFEAKVQAQKDLYIANFGIGGDGAHEGGNLYMWSENTGLIINAIFAGDVNVPVFFPAAGEYTVWGYVSVFDQWGVLTDVWSAGTTVPVVPNGW